MRAANFDELPSIGGGFGFVAEFLVRDRAALVAHDQFRVEFEDRGVIGDGAVPHVEVHEDVPAPDQGDERLQPAAASDSSTFIATQLAAGIDENVVRLCSSEEGRRVIEAMRRLNARMKAEAG